MKTVGVEETTIDTCVDDAQRERIVVTRKGKPVALIVGIKGMDQEQIALGTSDEFWRLLAERRSQKTLSRAELDQAVAELDSGKR